MNHIYLGLLLSLFCVLLAYFSVPTLLLVAVICVVLAGLHFKDDFSLFRYVATHVASIYLWICEIYCNLQNMYHQSNNTNFPVRKSIVNNGTVSSKLDRLHHRLKTNPHNLNSSYVYEAQPLSSSNWNSNSNISPTYNYLCSRPQSTLQDMSRLNISSNKQRNEEIASQRVYSSKPVVSTSVSSRMLDGLSPIYKESPISTITDMSQIVNTSRIENDRPSLDAKLYANVNSPGFCSRVAERLPESMTHQPKYDSVGAFPVVHLKSQSPKIKIKTPVRVRLAPPTNDVLYSTVANSSLTSPAMLGTDESMKSVLQVLKEISRKRIHSHVDEDIEDNSKRLRINETQYANDNVMHTSLLQQTIQGKRAREDSSPNEDDVKKRRKPLQNNEILSSLSSSISVKPPHLKTKKRKAQDDAGSSISGLGNFELDKDQVDVTSPPPTALPSSPPTTAYTEECEVETVLPPTSPSLSAVESKAEQTPARAEEPVRVVSEPEQDGSVSRLLGRMSSETEQTTQQVSVKKNVFMSTNDLSLSPPKENRLAAMIAVLGGPSENLETDNVQTEDVKQPERNIIGKALFTSPATPDTPKKTKKVTFNDSLTMTKVYDRDQPNGGNASAVDKPSVVSHSAPLSSLTFGVSSCPTPTDEKVNFGSQTTGTDKPVGLDFGSPLFPSGSNEPVRQNADLNSPKPASSSVVFSTPLNASVHGGQAPVFLQPTNSSPTTLVTSSSTNPMSTFAIVSSPINSNLTTTENKIPATFSFGTINSSVLSQQESTTKLAPAMDSVAAKPFSFGSESKPSQAVSSSAFPSLFTSTSQNVATKSIPSSESTNVMGQNKPIFSMFTNKDATISSPGNKREEENKQLVNGFATTTTSNITSSFAFNASVTQAASNKALFPGFGTNTSNTVQAASTFNFGSPTVLSTSSTTTASSTSYTTTAPMMSDSAPKMFSSVITSSTISQHSPALLTSTANQPAQPINMFSNVLSSSSQAKPSPFGAGIQTSSQGSFVFGDGNSQIGVTFKATSNNTQSNMFGGLSAKTEPKPAAFGATGGNTSTQPPNPSFGLSTKPTSSEANGSPFGIPINSVAPQSNTMFGNPTTTAKPATLFGNVSSNTGQQNSPSFPISSATSGQTLFNNANGNQLPKAMFQNPSTTTTGFGAVNNTSVSAFGNQNNTAPSTFGTETSTSSAFGSRNNTTPAPNFGNQNNTTPSFGNQNISVTSDFGIQNNSLNNSQSGFNTSATFGLGTNLPNTAEVKPPAFNSSPFVFGSSAANKEPPKPFGAAAPFSFGSNVQQTNASLTSSAQPSLPTFGATNTGFGTSLQPQTFGANIPQPSAPTFFGQAPTAPGVSFQFNATTPQPIQGGGMFSIGSGSSAPRSKTGALRRRHKPT